MARILVTGATGFLGTRLVARLCLRHEVWALSRRKRTDASLNIRWLIQDLAEDSWKVRLPERMDAVIHLAQSPNYRDFPKSAPEIFAVNTATTLRLLDWAHRAGARHFVLASTGGLYGGSDKPVREDNALVDDRGLLGFYFATKRASELIVAQYGSRMTTAILRCFFIYGSRQSPQMLMPRLVDSVLQGRPINLQGPDGIRINPIHVDDAALAFERCLDLESSQIMNIAGPEAISLRGVAELIGAEVGRKPSFAVDEAAKPRHLVADIERMRVALGAPRTAMAEGIRELCGAAARDHVSA